MQFGLTNAPSTFQKFIHNTLRALSNFSDVYLESILIFRKSIPDHLEHVHTVLQRLSDKNLQSKRPKYIFLHKSLQFSRRIVLGKGVASDPEKVKAVV